jgi:hypothetical protein
MANCHTHFGDYLKAIALTNTQEDKLRTSRDALVKKISTHFEKKDYKTPDNAAQGSYALDTQNRPISDDFDLDHGIYCVHWEDSATVDVATAFKLVEDAVVGHTTEPNPYKETCVRVQYKAAADGTPAHHTDLAIYRKKADGTITYAHRTKGWTASDQKGFIDYFKKRVTDQVRALVRLFKGWADYQGNKGGEKMPSGFHFTVCVLECLQTSNNRDDRAFVATAEAVRERLSAAYQLGTGDPILRPVVPGEDIFSSYTSVRINHLVKKLDELIDLGKKALAETDVANAQRIWKELFGDRFSAPELPNTSKGRKIWTSPAIIGTHDKAA